MIQQNTLRFLKDLGNNNNKAWFDQHRKNYESAREDFLLGVTRLIQSTGEIDAAIGNLFAKDCIFRINRDVRFSKDKRPYKNNMACYFNKNGKKGNGAGYYLHIEPGKSFAGGGIWMPMAPELAKIRQEIDYSFAEWKQLIGNPVFQKHFTKGITADAVLTRPPKGYDENNPAINFIKMKSFTVGKSFSDDEVLKPSFIKKVTATFGAMKPMIDFLNKAVD